MSSGSSAITGAIAEPAETIEGVIERMEAIERSRPNTDGVVHFNRLYLAVTRSVQEGVRDVSFEDEPFLSRLDVVFANLYFKAIADWESHGDCSPAWRPLFAERERAWRRPIQFALCGMNAHINHDLPLAVCMTFHELGGEPVMNSPRYRDFARVNGVLHAVESKVKNWFLDRFAVDVDRATGDEADRFAMWSIADARAAAWHHARTLWRLRGEPHLEHAYLETLAKLVDLSNRAILI